MCCPSAITLRTKGLVTTNTQAMDRIIFGQSEVPFSSSGFISLHTSLVVTWPEYKLIRARPNAMYPPNDQK